MAPGFVLTDPFYVPKWLSGGQLFGNVLDLANTAILAWNIQDGRLDFPIFSCNYRIYVSPQSQLDLCIFPGLWDLLGTVQGSNFDPRATMPMSP